MNQLEQLRTMTTVVADTGDFNAIKQYAPRDATTNPSLLLKATGQPEYAHLIDEAMAYGEWHGGASAEKRMDLTMQKLAVNFGCEILKVVPGRVSTETDARLSFDADALVDEAHVFMKLYADAGVDPDRILIKIASTWEGIRAAERLEKEGIHCNLTLMFSLCQAIACAEGGITLISPFVGRIYDWYKAAKKLNDIPIEDDPGVESVTTIYNYYRKFGYKTEVMGASFRKREQIVELAGCDLLTIAPDLLEALAANDGKVTRRLDPAAAKSMDITKLHMDEKTFRWMLNEDAMGTEKLAQGIRGFNADAVKLRKQLAQRTGQPVGA